MSGPQSTRVTSSHWGAFELDVEGDRIVAARPFGADPTPPEIPQAIPAAVHHRSRVARPSIRKGWLETRTPGAHGAIWGSVPAPTPCKRWRCVS